MVTKLLVRRRFAPVSPRLSTKLSTGFVDKRASCFYRSTLAVFSMTNIRYARQAAVYKEFA
jgi:hypothetical protein